MKRQWQTQVSQPWGWAIESTGYGGGQTSPKTEHKFGFSTGVSTAAYETVWPGSGLYPFSTAAQTLEIVSASSNDDATSTGARTATVYGLGPDYSTRQETVTLTGTTPTTLASTGWLRALRAAVDTAGTNGANIGKISVRPSGGGTTYAIISAGANQTVQAAYTVPAGYSAHLVSEHVTAQAPSGGSNKTGPGKFRMKVRTSTSGVFRTQQEHPLAAGGHAEVFPIPRRYPAKSDIRFDAIANSSDVDVGAEFHMWIEPTS
jgi:hypothetical protein